MPDIQPAKFQPVALWCRFELAAGALSDEEFCAFDFPGCKRCPKAQRPIRT